MLLLGLGIMASVYAGKRLLDQRKSSSQTLSTQDEAKTTTPAESLRHITLSATSVAMVAVGHFYYPPLVFVSLGLVAYSLEPALEKARKNHKINNDTYTALITILLVAVGSYLAAAIHNVIYHLSDFFIQKSREDSARLTTETFQQAPEKVWILADGVEIQIPLEQVKQGDGVVVTTGSTIPVDGLILQGTALVDQQALTGEAKPVEKTAGEQVMAATIVLSGRVVISAQQSGAETRIDKLNELLQHTQEYKTQLQLKGEAWSDKVSLPVLLTSAVLIPWVGTSSALALLFSAPLNTVRSMLSVQTAAHMQGIMQHGAFIKDGRVLEELPKIDVVLFDKTGTLTQTHPEVAQIISCGDYRPEDLLMLAAAAEQRLEHPIALAIVEKAQTMSLPLPEVTHSNYDLGLGVTVNIAGQEVKVGSQRFIEQALLINSLPTIITEAMQAAVGHTFILIAIDGEIEGVLELYPRVREEVPELIQQLRQREFKQIAIVSGDQQLPTERLATQLQLDTAYGEVLPQDKASLIKELQEQGHHVCFVGDGLNDAIAMKQANVAVSLSSASAVTSEVAQIILLNDNLAAFGGLFTHAEHLHSSLGNSLHLWIGFGAVNALAVPLLGFGPMQSSLLYSAAYATGIKLSGQAPALTAQS